MVEPVDSPPVSVIIPNWNLKMDLVACIDSLLLSTYPALSIIVVDNASTDGSVEWIESHYPQVTLLVNKENKGYASALNSGIRYALTNGAQYFLALNNDTIATPSMISQLVEVMQANPHIGIAAPKVLYSEDPSTTFSLGDRSYRLLPFPIRFGRRRKDTSANNRVLYFDYLFGCALLLRKALIEQIGLFNTAYYMFFEDSDLCRRARDAGWLLARVGYTTLYHKASLSVKKSKPRMTYYRARSRIWFYRTYRHGPARWVTTISLHILTFYHIVRFFIKGQSDLIQHYWQGYQDGLRQPPPPLQFE